MQPTWRVLVGDVREMLATLPDCSVQCVVTSPPYWGLRDYGVAGQLGLEERPSEYIAAMVDVFAAVRRVLRDDGSLWLNLGDCYANDGKWGGETGGKQSYLPDADRQRVGREKRITGLKPKDLVGIPWEVAFALQADGWYLRADVIWSKPNPMPESVQDRPTKAHEYIFLLTKGERYFYDAEAIRTPIQDASIARRQRNRDSEYEPPGQHPQSGATFRKTDKQRGHGRRHAGFNDRWDAMEKRDQQVGGANCRSVWSIATQPYPGAHFATFPEAIPERCIKAGSRIGDVVLDPFAGSGTTGQVAIQLGRSFVGIELNPTYAELARQRIGGAAPLFATEAAL
jgi:DNA modification methylase